MEKSIFSRQYTVLLELLRETRRAAKLTQVELAEKLGKSQSFVSKTERGEVRLDVIQLRTICLALDTALPDFVMNLERRLMGAKKEQRTKGERGLRHEKPRP